MMAAAVISLIDNDSEIFTEINIIGFSDIEIMFGMFAIARIEWLQDINKILLRFYDYLLVVVGDVDVVIELQF